MTETDDPREPERLTDPRVMRALAHPVRLDLYEALAVRGPLTATQAGAIIDESPTTCSFHLRQLAKYGLAEEAGGGPGRNRPWRLVRIGFVTDPEPDDVAGQLASQALGSVTLGRQVARHERSVWSRPSYPPAWRDAGWQSETVWWITREEFREIEAEVDALLHRYVDRLTDPATRPADAVPVEFVALAHVFQEMADFDDADVAETDADDTDDPDDTHDTNQAADR